MHVSFNQQLEIKQSVLKYVVDVRPPVLSSSYRNM